MSKPGIVICEYNGIFGDVHPLTVPADDNFDRMVKHPSGLYWGASIGGPVYLPKVFNEILWDEIRNGYL